MLSHLCRCSGEPNCGATERAEEKSPFIRLLFLKRQAIGALIHGRICFMRAHGDAIKRTIFTAGAVIRALGHVALDRTIFFTTFHDGRLLSEVLARE